MSKDNVIQFGPYKAQADQDAGFLGLIDDDIKSNPERIVPIPQDLFTRMDTLMALAKSSCEEELLEM